jgi:hypothetical protein
MESLAEIAAKCDEILALLKKNAPKEIASDADLDGKWGDPVVKARDPKDWTGETCIGKKFSECPVAYLEMMAERSDYFAAKNDELGAKDEKGRPKSHWDRKNAALARGWARRLRSGWKPAQTSFGGNDDERTPF